MAQSIRVALWWKHIGSKPEHVFIYLSKRESAEEVHNQIDVSL